ncbi:hypothetical protein FE633_15095 [Streptomyces montanus]|uniref:Uncharacterized protein n=1 Tax=Streptomyces montanus TaxID=2580423 RepID=A0A5R9FRU0_9ACTN|nr:hypothetical protein [Streptomyces montanus]TLS45389.1 hypothetical protein FE633_15095 [Streptomyces montanus]
MYVNPRMAKVNAALAVLLLLFVSVVALRAVIGPDMAWRYDKVLKDTGGLSGVMATAADDIWAAGDGFLLHYDGTGWQRRPMPTAFGRSVDNVRLDAVDSGGLLLTARLVDGDTWRMAHWDGTRWTALPKLPNGHRAMNVRALAADDIWALDGEAYHWDGTRWTTAELPIVVSALDGVASDDLWAVGYTDVDENGDRGPELTQPAAAHWDGRAWKLVPTPDYHFPAPAPAEPGADLTNVVVRAKDDVRAYGEHTYNPGEEGHEPDFEDIRLRWNGTRWTKLPNAKGACADRGHAVRDGERGAVLSAGRYLTADGDCEGISSSELPSTGGIRSSAKQSLWLNAIAAIPGTDKILGVGSVEVSQSGDPTSRSVIVSLKR